VGSDKEATGLNRDILENYGSARPADEGLGAQVGNRPLKVLEVSFDH
jgi:hypothetical protein